MKSNKDTKIEMTPEEAMYCMGSYLPDTDEFDCRKCRFYASQKAGRVYLCRSSNAHKIAIEAISKQIKMEPIGKHTNYKGPVCGRRVRSGMGSSSYGKRDYFCQKCGQKLDWEKADKNADRE